MYTFFYYTVLLDEFYLFLLDKWRKIFPYKMCLKRPLKCRDNTIFYKNFVDKFGCRCCQQWLSTLQKFFQFIKVIISEF